MIDDDDDAPLAETHILCRFVADEDANGKEWNPRLIHNRSSMFADPSLRATFDEGKIKVELTREEQLSCL